MNIFFVDSDPVKAAQALCDKHVVKMSLESAQMLCTAAHVLGFEAKYKPTHKNHPCSLWLMQGRDNLAWLISHTFALFSEYTRRYGRIHASSQVITELQSNNTLSNMLITLPARWTLPAQAMPDQYKNIDPVKAYRAYYSGDKAGIAVWKDPQDIPNWWQ